MGTRRTQFAPGEWFHCYTRGVDKRIVFMDESDGTRFQALLYACNNIEPIHVSDFVGRRKRLNPANVFSQSRKKILVDIAAYCLMPNHPHILMREIDYGGISTFMQKLGTAYTMYFNKKYERTGALFSGPFKAVHVENDLHFRRLINYIHANPAEMYEPGWKRGIIKNKARLKRELNAYVFSSLMDYLPEERLQNAIISRDAAMELLDFTPSFNTILKDARDFYRLDQEHMDSPT